MHTQPNAHVFWNVGGIQSTWKKNTQAQEQRVDTHIKARKLVPCTCYLEATVLMTLI